ncbi:hypothetical protein ABZO31_00635 [Streptomyces sp. HUAS MG47]
MDLGALVESYGRDLYEALRQAGERGKQVEDVPDGEADEAPGVE